MRAPNERGVVATFSCASVVSRKIELNIIDERRRWTLGKLVNREFGVCVPPSLQKHIPVC